MSIHSEIKRLRLRKGWSQQDLATAVSEAEGLKRPLRWQTVQQWEREPAPDRSGKGKGKSTAPKRKRLATVAAVLETTTEALMSGAPQVPRNVDQITGQEGLLLGLFRFLSDDDQVAVITLVREKAAMYNNNSAAQTAPEKRPDAA